MRIPIASRGGLFRSSVVVVAFAVLCLLAWVTMVRMPGRSYRGHPPASTLDEIRVSSALRVHVQELAGRIGDRSVFAPWGLRAAEIYLTGRLEAAGYVVGREAFRAHGMEVANLVAERRGCRAPREVVLVGAHYDSVGGTVGADDNASGVAMLLVLAEAFAHRQTGRSLRWVAFVNEEPPFYRTAQMGSVVHASRGRRGGERIVAMLSLETIGYYSEHRGSQAYPWPMSHLYPDRGDFVAFVGDVGARGLVRQALDSFRRHARFPSEGAALPGFVPGVGWSDHWSFREQGVPAIMVTDTAPFRNPYYHTDRDVPATLDYARAARVASGLIGVVEDLAR